MVHLPSESLHKGVVLGVKLVGTGVDLYLGGPVCKLEGGDGLLNGLHQGVQGGDEDGGRVAAKGVFEQAGQLGLSVGDDLLVLGEGGDDLAQGRQGQVDALVFLHVLLSKAFFQVDLLASGQIAKVDSRLEDFALRVLCLEHNLEHGVGSGRADVGFGFPCDPVGLASLEKEHAIIHTFYQVFRQSFHKDSLEFVLSDLQGSLL